MRSLRIQLDVFGREEERVQMEQLDNIVDHIR